MRVAQPYGAFALLALASALWAGNSVIGRALRETATPLDLSLWRWVISTLCLAPFCGREFWRHRRVLARSLPLLALCAFTGTGPCNWLVFYGLRYTSAINAQLFNSMIPLWVMLITWTVLRARTGALELTGLAVSLAGVVVIVAAGDPRSLLALDFNGGDLIILGALFLWAVYIVLLRYRPMEVSPLCFVMVIGGLGALMLLPLWALQVYAGGTVLPSQPGVIGGILYLALAASLLASAIHSIGVQRVGPSRAALFTHLVPVFGAIMSVGLIGEAFHAYHAIAFALVLAGLWIANRSHPRYT